MYNGTDRCYRETLKYSLASDNGLIALSITIFVAAMLLSGLLFLPMIASSLKTPIQTFTAYFTANIVVLAVVGITSVLKRKF